MIRAMTEKEIAEQRERVSHLYTSKWLVDNLTAIMMDMNYGTGLHESDARQKAHKVIAWLEFQKQLLPDDEPKVSA